MTKQLEGLCPHDRLLTAYCPDCAIDEEIDYPTKQIDWKAEVVCVDEIVGTNAYIDGELQPKREGVTYKVKGVYGESMMSHPDIVKEQEDRNEFFRGLVHPSRNDIINNPQHYKVGGYEAIDVIRAKLTPEEFRGY